jgi:hypothetical protein
MGPRAKQSGHPDGWQKSTKHILEEEGCNLVLQEFPAGEDGGWDRNTLVGAKTKV